jgi:site-specific recombinase XerD
MSTYSRLKPGHILAQRWFARAALEAHANAYVQYLTERGYARETVERYFRSVAHFVRWISQQDVALCDLSETLVNRFLDGRLPRCRCAPRCRRARVDARAALKHFLAMLGKAQTQLVPIVSASIAAELTDFERYLVEVRGLSNSTRTVRRRDVLEFLVDRFGTSTVRISKLGPADVVRFVMRRTHGLMPGSVRSVVLSLRSYFLFKASCGTPTTPLIAALPRVALWRLAGLPEVLTPVEIGQLLNAFDRDSATGMRDFAITRCLLDLGLRRVEVAHLRLDDIDWRAGVLRIRGKGKRTDVVPLPRLTGQAIAAYLEHGRPQTTRREVFVRHRPPLNAAANVDIIRNAVRYAAERCGLQQRVRGTHIFRHTMACRMAQGGTPFKEIADLLRHRSLNTTTIYAKVDLPALRRVALPWPGRRP